jgi:quercetin dioxygenase-like cupin family protein
MSVTAEKALKELSNVDMVEAWSDDDASVRVRFGVLEDASTGTAASALFYFEVPEGRRTPRHTHTAEEVVLVLDGEAEGFVGEARRRVSAGDTVVIPSHAWHGFENVGRDTFRFLGFFASGAMVHVFKEKLMPMGTEVFVTPPQEAE